MQAALQDEVVVKLRRFLLSIAMFVVGAIVTGVAMSPATAKLVAARHSTVTMGNGGVSSTGGPGGAANLR